MKIERDGLGHSHYVRPWMSPTVCTIAGARHLGGIVIAVVAGSIWARYSHRCPHFSLDIWWGDSIEDSFILSQSEVTPRPSNPSIPSSKHIQSSSGIITTFLEEQRDACTKDLQLQTCSAANGRVYTYHDALQCKQVIIKIAMPATANLDQAPATLTLEEVLDTIIKSLSLTFPVDIVAIFNYAKPIDNVKCTSSTYYSFAFLSPHFTQKQDKNHFMMEYSFLYARLANLLKGPTQALRNIPNLPPITNFLTITAP